MILNRTVPIVRPYRLRAFFSKLTSKIEKTAGRNCRLLIYTAIVEQSNTKPFFRLTIEGDSLIALFQKGNKLGGRPALPEELRGIKMLSKDEVRAIFSKYARMSIDEMRVMKEMGFPNLSVIDAWILSGMIAGISKGDWTNLNYMFDRIFGRPKQELEATDPEEDNKPRLVITLPSNGKEANLVPVDIEDEQ